MNWLFFKIVVMMVLIYFFSLGLMLMDYGASFKCFKECGGLDAYLQSLVFERIEPRVVYHLGLVFVVASFMFAEMIVAYEFSRGDKK